MADDSDARPDERDPDPEELAELWTRVDATKADTPEWVWPEIEFRPLPPRPPATRRTKRQRSFSGS
ncbi:MULTISPECIES: hypothetical protein [unclassified Nocardia]|uniref:hypothetical protein n=1 Tax=unclassified Nocardia TaxID=2637762 RepID=UPI00278C08D4|nr:MULTISPECIES: hypothetical protein [unclassified Nocardia]